MAELGPAKFYSPDFFTSNPPGFLYIFWVIGLIKKNLFPNLEINSLNYDLLLKLPTNLADIFSGLIIYSIVKEKLNSRWAILGFVLFVFNPTIFFNSSIFGQFDGFASLFSLLSIYLFVKYKNPEISILSFAISWAIKPQAIAIVPILLILIIINSKPLRYLTTLLTFIISTLVIYLPFFPNNPISGFFRINQAMTNIFSCTTCFAFNFWGLFGNWQNDLIAFLNLKLILWGIILFSVTLGLILIKKPFLIKFKSPFIYLTTAISVLVFFTFLTRMHERYLFGFFPFFLIGALLLRSRLLLILYAIFSGLSVLNIYLPYAYYNSNLKLTPSFVSILTQNFKLLSIFEVFLSILTVFVYLHIINRPSYPTKNYLVTIGLFWKNMNLKLNINRLKIDSKTILILILLFTFFSRAIRIGYPNTYVFDEVYHAFTAKEYLKGSIKAWEWWNTPPPGVAYEWTHPPLAKEIMTASMFILNSTDAWAYRIPGVLFGVLSVYLIYQLGKILFKSQSVGLFSAFIFSIDGLNFVQSRTGMNDIYFVTFSLLCLVFYFKNKFFFSSIALGLALASKWTTFYLFGFLLVLLIWNRKIKKIYWFIIIPIIIYLLTYLPFFTTGHSFNQFIS
ncbi:glycosyltransferase family 39 protein, partial [Candidatus Daviesbacteria bacterium]|nr:glycosyltransferase family 39 protein [Candidatus Daviesbacteria bacterium]